MQNTPLSVPVNCWLKWFEAIGEPILADAILDRIVHTAYRFELKGESLRKKCNFGRTYKRKSEWVTTESLNG
jgi:hypothetical protein